MKCFVRRLDSRQIRRHSQSESHDRLGQQGNTDPKEQEALAISNRVLERLLHIKKTAIEMLLRNLRINRGLCNEARLLAKDMRNYFLGCRVITGPSRSDYVLRTTVLPNDHDLSPVKLKRRQFLLRLSFAMTIIKSEGQAFSKVGPPKFIDIFT